MNKQATPEMISRVAERFAALADETRIRIMMRLHGGECNVSTLSAELGVSQPSVSKHLGILRHAGMVEVRREGTQSICSVRDRSTFDLCEIVCSGVLRHQADVQSALGMPRPPVRRARLLPR